MLKDSFAPAKRAFAFFGCMGILVGGLTLGSGLQVPTDQSSTTIAAMRGLPDPATLQLAAVNRSEKTESAAKRAIAGSSQQAMAAPATQVILR